MVLVPRYLHAVRALLPKAQADDITAELSDSIQSRIEERTHALGRPLTLDEEADVLRTYGPPPIAASRYWKQQYLIGPGLLPYYFQTLKICVAVVLALSLAVDGVFAIAKADALGAFVNFWGTIWGSTILVCGVVTIVFALLERYQPKDLALAWNPRSLPAVREERVSRVSSAVELAINAGAAVWLLGSQSFREFVLGPSMGAGLHYVAGLPFDFPWLHRLAQVVFAVAVVNVLLAAVNLLRPDWLRLRAAVMVCTNAVMLATAGSILATGTLVTPGVGPSHVGDVVGVARVLNWLSVAGLWGLSVGCAISVVVAARQLMPSRDRAALNMGLDGGAPSSQP